MKNICMYKNIYRNWYMYSVAIYAFFAPVAYVSSTLKSYKNMLMKSWKQCEFLKAENTNSKPRIIFKERIKLMKGIFVKKTAIL